jgi:hypothetical protein
VKGIEVFLIEYEQIETNIGITGYGENTPLGPTYLPAYAKGTRAGITVRVSTVGCKCACEIYQMQLLQALAPSLMGADPTKLHKINYIMDTNLKGHPYVKSAIDMACWDILGKVGRFRSSLLKCTLETLVSKGYWIACMRVVGWTFWRQLSALSSHLARYS